jgi:lipoprotein-releasing system permease protein
MLRFETTLALRHLRSGGGQTVLTVSAVATGVAVIVFMSSMLFGVRAHVAEMLTDILPHVTVQPPEPEPTPLAKTPDAPAGLAVSRIERQNQQRKEIENWQRAAAIIQGIPHVRVVAPVVSGQGFVSRGEKRVGAQVYGADPRLLDVVLPITKYLVAGRYLDLNAGEIFLSYKVSHDLRVAVGDRVRLTSSEGLSDSYLIVGVFDSGQDVATAYVTLRDAQSLYATGTAVRTLLVKTDDLFDADDVADRIAALLPYEAKSWSRQYPQFVSWLWVYKAIAYLISGFSLVASGFAIAAVLIVSVLQKSKQIGILKSIGAKRRQILTVFLLEGLGIALIGGVVGALLGSCIAWILKLFKMPVTRAGAKPEEMFHTVLTWQLIAAALLAAVVATLVAAILPARRAACMNPVEVMR